MAVTATLSSQYRLSIPKAMRDTLGWRTGQELVFIPKGKGVLVMPAPQLDRLAGLARQASKTGYRDRKDRY